MKKSDLRLEFECQQLPKSTGETNFCERCQESVTDLSAMTHREAKAFLKVAVDPCIQYRVDAGQNIVFMPSVSKLTKQIQGAQRLVSAAALVPILTLVACDVPTNRAESVGVTIVETTAGAASLNLAPNISSPQKTRPTSSYDGNVAKPGAAVGFKAAYQRSGWHESSRTLREALEDTDVIVGGRLMRVKKRKTKKKPSIEIIKGRK